MKDREVESASTKAPGCPSDPCVAHHSVAPESVSRRPFFQEFELEKHHESDRVDKPLEKPLVVFVDDDELFIESLEPHLRPMTEQWDTRLFTSSAEALRVLKSSNGGILVSDWMMPGLDGATLCETLHMWADTLGHGPYYTILLTGLREQGVVEEALDRGADDVIKKPARIEELFSRIRVGIRSLMSQRHLHEENELLSVRALHDHLTGVFNRAGIEELLHREVSRTSRGLQDLGVMLIDLDHFKEVNDALGHTAGDHLLKGICSAISTNLRKYDALGRWGGDEFLAVLPYADEQTLRAIAARICIAVHSSSPDAFLGTGRRASVSIGIARLKAGETENPLDTVKRADNRLYIAKRRGRDCAVI